MKTDSDEQAALVGALRESLGESAVLVGADAAPMLSDVLGHYTGSALAVVRPRSTDEVTTVVRTCADAGVAIVPQGGNTGLSGGSVPDDHHASVLVSLALMNRIESVNPEQWTMTVEAGATIQAIQEAAAAADRLFAPDWGARGTASIGGAIATDAGGMNVLRYGNIRDNVLGLEVVLADGRVWDGLRSLRKDSSGYDLKHLFIGSEGTLGIATRAVVKLWPATPYVQSALASITGLGNLSALLELAQRAAPGLVTAFELVPDAGLDRVCEAFNRSRPLDTREDWYILVKLASSEPVTDALAGFLSTAESEGLISDAVVAVTSDHEEQLWMIRDEIPPTTLFPHYHAGLKMDVAVPLDQIAEFHDRVGALAAELAPGALPYGFGHVGDGNLHMYVMPVREEDVSSFLAAKAELTSRIDQEAFALKGTLSAEHGVGQLLRDRIAGQKSEVEWDMMRTVKAALDPDNLMNPGKTLPDPR